MPETRNAWCGMSLDVFSLENRVRKWFLNNFCIGDVDENDLIFLLTENPTNYHNITLAQCLDWIKGTYSIDADKESVEHMLIDLVITYTDTLSVLKKCNIGLNDYVKKYYL